jgi:hypothetical protein
MHSEWEALIPYYVAGTLSKGETTRLEHHLSKCAECTKSVEEWRAIAGAVRDNAASQMRALPPLSRAVTVTARRQAAVIDYETVSRLATRRSNTPITLIAAAFTVILFGGLVALLVVRSFPRESEFVALLPTATVTIAASENGAPSLEPQIVVIEPTTTPVPTKERATPPSNPLPTEALATAAEPPTVIAPNPTQPLPPTQQIFPTFVLPTSTWTPEPPQPPTPMVVDGMGGGNGNADALSFAAPEIEGQAQTSLSMQSGSCEIRAAVSSAILYEGIGTDSAILGTISGDDILLPLGMSRGWYNVQYPDGKVGWVQQEMVYTTGNCADLPILGTGGAGNSLSEPTPIPPLVESPLVLIPANGINLRGGPGTDYPQVGTARSGESYHVEAQYTRQSRVWYRLTIPGAAPAWISASLVQLSPGNATVPRAETIPATPAAD